MVGIVPQFHRSLASKSLEPQPRGSECYIHDFRMRVKWGTQGVLVESEDSGWCRRGNDWQGCGGRRRRRGRATKAWRTGRQCDGQF